nr:hypothetical protein [Tanacetum cinerariifolium]
MPTLDNTTHNLGSGVFTLELRDLPHKINKAVRKSVKKAIYIALQDPLIDCFRELHKADMKEILYQRMFKSGSYKLLPKIMYHSMKLLRCPWNGHKETSFLLKRTSLVREDSSAWKKSDTRDAPPSVSNQQSDPYAEQPVEDIPMTDTGNISDSEETDSAHLLKIKQRLEWLKPLPDGERLATPKPVWKFNTDRHIADSSRKVFRTHLRILSVVSIKAFSRYGYDYLKEITLCRADYQEYKIAEKHFKNKRMPSIAVKLWTRNLVIRQRVEDFQLGSESYQKQLNLTKPGWDTKCIEYKHDYTIIDLPRAVVFPLGNNKRKIMRFNEIYKFSDGTLTNIMEALDFRVKEYKTQDQKDLPKLGMLCWWLRTRY